METVRNAGEVLDFVDKISKFLEKMSNYKPEVKSLRINYLTKTTELKLLISVPRGMKRRFRDIEIPMYENYQIKEVFDGSTLNRLDIAWKQKNNNWLIDADLLKASDKYFVILEGGITDASLEHLVKLYCPGDPKRTSEADLYWIDSAIKDMSILEKIYDELTIDKVTTNVNVGVERQFSSSMPREVKEWLAARAKADVYLGSSDRQNVFKSMYRLRVAQRKMGKLSPSAIHDLAEQVLSPQEFMLYVSVDKPFNITQINPVDDAHWFPEKVGVTVQTDLNYKNPVAQGDLTFKKIDFASKLAEDMQKLPGLPDKVKEQLKKQRVSGNS